MTPTINDYRPKRGSMPIHDRQTLCCRAAGIDGHRPNIGYCHTLACVRWARDTKSCHPPSFTVHTEREREQSVQVCEEVSGVGKYGGMLGQLLYLIAAPILVTQSDRSSVQLGTCDVSLSQRSGFRSSSIMSNPPGPDSARPRDSLSISVELLS